MVSHPGELTGELGLHQAALTYASDFGLLGTGMLPHQLSFMNPKVQAASLDHAIWFYHAFRADEWLLYDMESPSGSGPAASTVVRFTIKRVCWLHPSLKMV